MEEIRFSIILATRNRPEDLRKCIHSLGKQSRQPYEVIIVDDGDLSEEQLTSLRSSLDPDVEWRVTESHGPAGLSVARNTGIRLATGNIVVILDDDVILDSEYLEDLARLYLEHDSETLAGIGGYDSRLREHNSLERLFRRFFYHESSGWGINKVGIQSWRTPDTGEIIEGNWLQGNNASYKREVIIEQLFPQWNGGREALEDIAVGWNLKQDGYHCLIDPNLGLEHNEAEDNESPYQTGVKEGQNRVRIFKSYGESQYLPLFIWAMLGLVLKQFLAPIIDKDYTSHFRKGLGMAVGSFTQLLTEPSDPDY